jgi:GNAT superfamily N-acetyltransferase
MRASPSTEPSSRFVLREIDAASAAELEWVAQGMRRTLMEVEGDEVGGSLYTLDWLRARARWHLEPASCTGAIFVAADAGAPGAGLGGYTIVRVETDEDGRRFGLFSTTFVDPAHRRAALASRLLLRGEQWMAAQGLPSAATWTSSTNERLIGLYAKHGYARATSGPNDLTGTLMVRLEKALA